jgi:protein TonB
MKSTLLKHTFATFTMLGGAFVVFSTVLYMNQREKPAQERHSASTVSFEVAHKPPPKKKEVKQRQQRRPKQTRAEAPRAPDLSSQISGAAIAFEGIGGFSVDGASNELIGSFDEKAAMTEDTLDTPPKLEARGGNLEYPKAAQTKGLEGYVLLNLFVGDDGRVGGVKVLDAKPSGVFEESARTFVREWSFAPGTYEGQVVGAWVKQKIVFQLQKT